MPSERQTLISSPGPSFTHQIQYGATDVEDDVSSINSSQSTINPQTKIRNFLIFVPLASLLLFSALITILIYSFRHATAPRQTIILNWTLAPFASAVVVWIACYTNKSYIISLFNTLGLSKLFSVLGKCGNVPSIFVQNLIAEFIRFATLFLNRPDEKVFGESYTLYTSCWVAFGWASAEVIASIIQGYSHLTLYADYPMEVEAQIDPNSPLEMLNTVEVTINEEVQNNGSPVVLSQYIDEQLCDLLNMKRIFEIEAAYGCPVTDVPIIVSVVQRLDSIFASLGLTLILSSSFHHPKNTNFQPHSLLLTYLATAIIHTVLSSFWCPKILPGIGVHTASFIACMISIGCCFAGLWMWGLLI